MGAGDATGVAGGDDHRVGAGVRIGGRVLPGAVDGRLGGVDVDPEVRSPLLTIRRRSGTG